VIRHQEGKGRNFCICVRKVDGGLHPIGGVGLKTNTIPNTQHCVELGYWLGESYWNKGIGTEALSLLVKYAFSDTFTQVNDGVEVERLSACIFEYNNPSAKILEKNGFHKAYTDPKAYKKEGKLIDGLMYLKFKNAPEQSEENRKNLSSLLI